VFFVHADGGMSYDAEGYYCFIWQALTDQSYAIIS
jgi:hypothetical protein